VVLYQKLDFSLPIIYLSIVNAKNVAVASFVTRSKDEFE
jgi:hypothetical protein